MQHTIQTTAFTFEFNESKLHITVKPMYRILAEQAGIASDRLVPFLESTCKRLDKKKSPFNTGLMQEAMPKNMRTNDQLNIYYKDMLLSYEFEAASLINPLFEMGKHKTITLQRVPGVYFLDEDENFDEENWKKD